MIEPDTPSPNPTEASESIKRPLLDVVQLDPKNDIGYQYQSEERRAKADKLYEANIAFCSAVNSGEPFRVKLRRPLNPNLPDLVSAGVVDYHDYEDYGERDLPGNLHYALIITDSGKILPFPLFERASGQFLCDGTEAYKRKIAFHPLIDLTQTKEALQTAYQHPQFQNDYPMFEQFLEDHCDLIHRETFESWFKEMWGNQFTGIQRIPDVGNTAVSPKA